jgi:hypothetical protein
MEDFKGRVQTREQISHPIVVPEIPQVTRALVVHQEDRHGGLSEGQKLCPILQECINRGLRRHP